eukprot:GSA120T00002181001.1
MDHFSPDLGGGAASDFEDFPSEVTFTCCWPNQQTSTGHRLLAFPRLRSELATRRSYADRRVLGEFHRKRSANAITGAASSRQHSVRGHHQREINDSTNGHQQPGSAAAETQRMLEQPPMAGHNNFRPAAR